MLRRLTVSVLFLLGFLAVAGFAQPPAKDPKPAEKKAVDPLDALIGAALANDADVKMAQAKLQLAEVEVARARQQVAQKVVALDSAVREQKKLVATSEQMFTIASEVMKKGQGSFSDLLLAREKLELTQAKLAQLETELKSMTGTRLAVGGWHELNKAQDKAKAHDAAAEAFMMRLVLDLHAQKAPAGPISDRIRAALDKPVRLGTKDAKVTLEQALEIFKKEAGLDVPVRVDAKITPIVSLGEELPVGAWLQLFADGTPETRILVREYGLLVTHKNLNPPDAISVFDFWKQKPAATPSYNAPKSLDVSGRYKGVVWKPAEGEIPLAKAAARLGFSKFDAFLFQKKENEWEAAKAQDHLLVRMPEPRDFGFNKLSGDSDPIELLIGLGQYPDAYPDVWMWLPRRNELLKFKDTKPEVVREFTEALRKVLPVK